MKNELEIRKTFNAPIEKLWAALTTRSAMNKWNFPELQQFEAVPGFKTEFNVHHEGRDFLHIWEVKEVDAPKSISWLWKYGGYPGESLLTIKLEPAGDGTELTLKHSGFDSYRPDLHPELASANFQAGWEGILGKSLVEYLES